MKNLLGQLTYEDKVAKLEEAKNAVRQLVAPNVFWSAEANHQQGITIHLVFSGLGEGGFTISWYDAEYYSVPLVELIRQRIEQTLWRIVKPQYMK